MQTDLNAAAPDASAILAENVRVHAAEAERYRELHPEIFNRYEQKLLQGDLENLLLHEPGRALDLGPGSGNITLQLLAKGVSMTAVDISKEMLDLLATRAEGPLELVHLPIDHYLETRPQIPPLVTMSSFLHQLPSPFATLRELARQMPVGGKIYITHEPTGLRSGATARGLLLLDRVLWNVRHPRLARLGRGIDYSISDYNARAGLDPKRVTDLLREEGFVIEHMRLYAAAKSALLARLATRLGSEIQITLIAKKIETDA